MWVGAFHASVFHLFETYDFYWKTVRTSMVGTETKAFFLTGREEAQNRLVRERECVPMQLLDLIQTRDSRYPRKTL